jgi:nicotinamide mononucleotide transporter
LVAQVLLALRFVDTWRWWILIDTVAVIVFWQRELYPTAVLYGLFWGMAWIGWREWKRAAT